MEELIAYLKENGIAYTEVSDAVVEIDGRTYELYVPADDGSLFDDGFCFIGKPYDTESHSDNETLADRYVYRFGGVWYWLDRGQENDVKLNRLKYLGESTFPLPTDTFLGVHGQYEILSGSGTYTDWCRKAKFLGVRNLGVCEVNSLAGALKFQMECQKFGIKPIIGMGCTVYDIGSDVRFVVKVYARNFEGWQTLLTINTEINCVNSGWVALDRFREIVGNNDDITVILDPKTLDYEEFRKANIDTAFYQLDTCAYSDERHDEWYLKNLKKFFYDTNLVPLVFSDAWYIDAEYADIPDRLHRIAGKMGYASDNQYFKSNEAVYEEFLQLFSEEEVGAELFLESMQLLNDIADGCDFTIDTANRHLPKYEMKPDEAAKYTTNEEMFLGLIEEGLEAHPELVDRWGEDVVLERLEREIDVIKFGNVIDYFLITRDIVNWCHENDILTGISRGSAGGCLISYLIGITKLDPLEYGLLFERFLNKGRVLKSLPDIDVDFTSIERPRVKKYMEERYGWDRVCSVGTYSALQLRAAIKDVCRIYGLEFQTVNEMMKAFDVDDRKPEDLFKIACADENVKKFVTEHPDIVNEVMLLMPAPKAQSIHACATMIFPKEHDMFHWVPIRKQGEEYVSEWEGNEMDGAGFLKQDILGVKQLDKFQEMITLIKENEGVDVDIYSTPLDDREVYRYFCNGWNEDNFHFGSRGLTGYCKQMQPRNIEDLIAAISLYRPGAMENGFHEEYIIRKADPSKVKYWVGAEKVLEKTFGLVIYQESVMELCKVLGGLSLVEADDVRKAMVKKKYEALHQYHERFTPYYVENFGVSHDYAESVWEAIDKASLYLFNRSHAAAYAITGYISQWLKVHYPIEYWSVAFKYATDDDYPRYIAEINKTGVCEVKPVNINISTKNVVIDFKTQSLYWSIMGVKQVADKAADQILKERDENGQYWSIEDFVSRHNWKGTAVNSRVIKNLILSGAFDSIENITDVRERVSLLRRYFEKNRIKIDDSDPLLNGAYVHREDGWWWRLMQKQLSGFAFFRYDRLYENNRGSFPDEYSYVTVEQCNDTSRKVKAGEGMVVVGGYVSDVEVKTTKGGRRTAPKTFCKMTLESNYEFIEVLVFGGDYDRLQEFVKKAKNNIILINGSLSNDSKKGVNIIRADMTTRMLIFALM